ncbi:hypothetical protein [Clostridium botulinum]|uniref:hypothetical protein n=1 Tax=Clostridium botulinum TaxID=1491 RepID=UPI0004D8C4DA|nr:hypothetical protein [Clostridium botulinum]KEH99955.1 hypothetical protein Z952_14615 [Clostridium botulinum C/D str. BKT75002]KEI05677.1 hypothetical protein Z954_14795 [Clostridium botulinum C/D str. BKT2873]MCD3352155.1 hypothetical protein [Clostridium botulinum D/C]MCD3361103.1 hypothetical protein [Clostridium botulinum D/C]MCD3363451.1 hypothetical protein [Clostridium botulinum D/C]
MISNIKPYCCCRQCLNTNKNYYIEVRNQCTHYLNFLLCYKINGKRVMKASPAFAPGKVQHIVFPGDATELCLTIFDSSFNPPSLICSKLPSAHMINRYKVVNTSYNNFECINI